MRNSNSVPKFYTRSHHQYPKVVHGGFAMWMTMFSESEREKVSQCRNLDFSPLRIPAPRPSPRVQPCCLRTWKFLLWKWSFPPLITMAQGWKFSTRAGDFWAIRLDQISRAEICPKQPPIAAQDTQVQDHRSSGGNWCPHRPWSSSLLLERGRVLHCFTRHHHPPPISISFLSLPRRVL